MEYSRVICVFAACQQVLPNVGVAQGAAPADCGSAPSLLLKHAHAFVEFLMRASCASELHRRQGVEIKSLSRRIAGVMSKKHNCSAILTTHLAEDVQDEHYHDEADCKVNNLVLQRQKIGVEVGKDGTDRTRGHRNLAWRVASQYL